MCREILLPNLRDSDYAISISGKAYGLRQDIRLFLEITGVTWKIKADETYQLRKSGLFCENVVLEEHEKLVIRTKRGEELELIVADSGLSFLTLEKYDFRQMSQISIGAAPQNEICYEFENLISSYHAAETLEKKRDEICLIALLDTLEYLKKGGRISKTVAFAGGLLNIKPVITVVDGEIQVIGKARGSKQGNNLLVQKIHESGGIDFDEPIILGYSGLSDSYLKKYVEDSRDIWQDKADSLDSTLICSVIGTHTGPGVVAVAFFKKG